MSAHSHCGNEPLWLGGSKKFKQHVAAKSFGVQMAAAAFGAAGAGHEVV